MRQPLVTTGNKNLWQKHTPEGATFCHEWIKVRGGKQNKRQIPKERQRLMLDLDYGAMVYWSSSFRKSFVTLSTSLCQRASIQVIPWFKRSSNNQPFVKLNYGFRCVFTTENTMFCFCFSVDCALGSTPTSTSHTLGICQTIPCAILT